MALLALLAGCATQRAPSSPSSPSSPAGTGSAVERSWSGRVALRIDEEPPRSFSAGFELAGNAQAGDFSLLSPLGQVLARLRWQPGQAELTQGNQTQTRQSLDELLQSVVGTEVPVRALFDWLQGQPTAAAGWQPDLSRLAQGRLGAVRLEPAPRAELRLVLDQP